MISAHDLPRAEINARIEGHEVDAVWRKARLVVELDGFAFHASRRAFERDRARDAQLTAAGWRVVRLTHRQVTKDGAATAALVRRLLGGARPAAAPRSPPGRAGA